jgi:hypothetical protein
MKYLVLYFVGLAIVSTTTAAELPNQPERKWTDNTGKFTITGSLLEVKEDEQSIVLQLADNRKVEVPLRRLSQFDQDYLHIMKRREKIPVASPVKKKLAVQTAPVIEQDQTTKPAAKTNAQQADEVSKLNGIMWFNSLQDAQRKALGKPKSPFDDKPIMCFRVLGELEGFM